MKIRIEQTEDRSEWGAENEPLLGTDPGSVPLQTDTPDTPGAGNVPLQTQDDTPGFARVPLQTNGDTPGFGERALQTGTIDTPGFGEGDDLSPLSD